MTRLTPLAAELANEGAVRAALGELTFESRDRNSARTIREVRSITNSQGLVRTSDFFDNVRTSQDTSAYKVVQPGMFVYNPSRINVGSVAWLDEPSPVVVSPMYVVFGLDTAKLIPEYLQLFFESRTGKRAIESKTEVGARFRLTYKALARIQLQLPSVAVQRRVVEVLSSFSNLRGELQAELDARREQLAHYRDELVTFLDGESRMVTFGDAATIVRGGSPRPIQAFLTDAADGINWIKIGDVAPDGKYITSTSERIRPDGASKSRSVSPGDFVLSNSMSFGRPYIVKIAGCIHDGWLAIKDFHDTFDPDFLYHLLKSRRVRRGLEMKAPPGTVQNLNTEIVKQVVLPAPSLVEQRRIAKILDKFDALVNDASIGLPAELAARRKQYEYYRDRLLTFEKAA